MKRSIGLAVIATLAFAGVARTAAAPPTLAEACGSTAGLEAQSAWLTTADGVRLYTVAAGSGSTAIVLAHQGGSDLCDTLPYATTLIAADFRVFAFDFRGSGRSESPSRHALALGKDLEAMVERSRAEGAKHVFLIGASMGGAAIVQNTSALKVDGRISLSGTRLWPGYGVNQPTSLRRIRAPFLYLGARDDWRAPLKEVRAILRRIGSHDKRLALYPGSDHGWALVDVGRLAANRRALILSWIRSRS
jgi:pimeloyl-ACP methyl ester carboxylesterase